MSDWWVEFVNDTASTIGPTGAVAAIALTAAAVVWVIGGVWFLWTSR